MRRRSWSRPLATLFLLSACSSAPRGAIEVELAPAAACDLASEAFEADWECLRIQVCPSSTGGGGSFDAGSADAGPRPGSRCVEIAGPFEDHSAAADELVVSRTTRITFDARVDPDTQYDVIVTAYDSSGSAVASGRSPFVRPLDAIRVRLYRYGAPSCGSVRADGALMAHRALGAAIPLANGDILFFGGVTGADVDAAQLRPVARFQRTVEVYDASSARFVDVAINNAAEPGAPAGFGRVLFEARDMGTDEQGRTRIRVFGGFGSAGAESVAVRFDSSLVSSAYGVPFLPGIDTSASPVVDILYDAAARTAEVVLAPAGAFPATGSAGVSEVVANRVVSVGGIATTGGDGSAETIAPTVQRTWSIWDLTTPARSLPLQAMGDPRPAEAFGRFGATVSYLGGTRFLVWGGGLTVPFTTDAMPMTQHLAFAGLLLDIPTGGRETVTVVASDTMTGLPAPVAFHTATRLSDDHVLVTGGLPIVSSFRVEPRLISSVGLDAAPGFSILVRDMGGLRSTPVTGTPRAASILHQATVIASTPAAATAILISGGALVQTLGTATSTLWSTGELGVVRGSADSWSYAAVSTLVHQRFGHTATLIPDVGVLIAGGYREDVRGMPGAEQVFLVPVLEPEVIPLADLLGLPRPEPETCVDGGPGADGGPRRDAGAPDVPIPDAPSMSDAPRDVPAGDAPAMPDVP